MLLSSCSLTKNIPDDDQLFRGLKEIVYIDEQDSNMPESKAQVIAETLTAVVFICRAIEKNGYTLSTMGEAAKAFIANWESEKYRKSLAGK